MKTLAFSYIRFSTPEQAKGDSLRRQTESTRAWCERNGVALDETTTLHDLGKSAYSGKHRLNPDRNALAAFLKLVEGGKVPRGSFLIIENLDRLSREDIQPALSLALDLLRSGVRLVQLKPEMVFDDKSGAMAIMMMITELSRGHGESAIKSERVGKAWAEKRRRLRENGETLTRQLPAWIEVRESDGERVLIKERSRTLKRIFQLAAGGHSQGAIVRRLAKEKVAAFGEKVVREGRKRSAFKGEWCRAYVAKLLRDRRVLGEYQPCGRDRKPEGEPIAGYFPAAITEAEWLAARGSLRQRQSFDKQKDGTFTAKKGRRGQGGADSANLFAGLLRNARDRGTYYAARRPDGSHLLVNTSAAESGAKSFTFPYEVFEECVLAALDEIAPRELVAAKDEAPDEVAALTEALAQVQAKLAGLQADLDEGGYSKALTASLRKAEAKEAELTEALEAARHKAAAPGVRASLKETQSLLALLDKAKAASESELEDLRTRLRASIRRTVAEVWLMVVPRGRQGRLLVVNIFFADGATHRHYLVLYRSALANHLGQTREASTLWRSRVSRYGLIEVRRRKFGDPPLPEGRMIDGRLATESERARYTETATLRDRETVQTYSTVLELLPIEKIAAALESKHEWVF